MKRVMEPHSCMREFDNMKRLYACDPSPADVYAKLPVGEHVKLWALKDDFLLFDNCLRVTSPF